MLVWTVAWKGEISNSLLLGDLLGSVRLEVGD